MTSLTLIKVMPTVAVKWTVSRGNNLTIIHRVKENSERNHRASEVKLLW